MALTVLEIAYALAPPLGPDAVGGAEQILGVVDGALARAGHRTLVVARAGSRVAGALLPTPALGATWDAATRAAAERAHEAAIRRALAAARPDLVHLHGLDFARFLPEGPPALVTLHLPPAWYPPGALRPRGRELALACVSESQARALPPGARLSAVVPNGVPLDAFHPAAAREPFALVLARICPEKGIAPALAAARVADVPLLVCGAALPHPEHLGYLEEQVRPLLDGARRLVGPVGQAEKARLLAAARCVVVPSLAPETSSLVAMEALASGTPVVARRVGALPEIVEDGRTGLLVDRDEDLGPAMRDAARLSSADCRRAAEARFSSEAAGRRWVAVIEGLARRPRPRAAPLRVEVLEGHAALAGLRDEWSDLCDRVPGATPFQRPEWLLPYCTAFGVAAPFAVALRARGRLAGLAPLVAFREGPRRIVTLLGAGISDYQDALVDPATGPAGAEALLRAMLARARGADALLLEHLPDGSPLGAAPAPHGEAPRAPDGTCPVLALGDGARPLDAAARGLRESVLYGRRRLARAGARITTASGDDLEAHLDALFAVHQARWAARGQAGVLAEGALRRFHREAARGLLARWLLRLHVLWVGGRAVAAFLGFLDRGRAFYYLGGFDPAERAASPGSVLVAHAVEQAAAEGARELDFLQGRERYKYDWGARDRITWRRVVVPAAGRTLHPEDRRGAASAPPLAAG